MLAESCGGFWAQLDPTARIVGISAITLVLVAFIVMWGLLRLRGKHWLDD